MVVVEYGPYIVLLSLSSESKEYKERFFFLNSFPSHRILAQTIHLCLTQRLGVICEEAPSLQIFQTKLAAYFIQINTDERFGPQIREAIHWEMLFRWFFLHLFSFDAKSEYISPDHMLFRHGNRVFMYIRPECDPKFPPEVLTIITKKEYPLIFKLLERTDEEFLMPELSLDFRLQLYRFYNMLIEFFPLAKVEGDEDETTRKAFYLEHDIRYNPEDSEANHVLEYLVGLREFLGPSPDYSKIFKT